MFKKYRLTKGDYILAGVIVGLAIGLLGILVSKHWGDARQSRVVADVGQSSTDDKAPSPEQAAMEASKNLAYNVQFRKVLRDLASARFANVRAYRVKDFYVFCGEVNSKNGFGGYSGFQPFFASPANFAIVGETPQSLSSVQFLKAKLCTAEADAGEITFP